MKALITIVAVFVAHGTVSIGGTFLVTSTNDTGPGSLRQAIFEANGVGSGTISLSVTGTIEIASSLPLLTNISILGAGSNFVIIRGTNQNRWDTNGFSLLAIPSNSICMLRGITVTGGGANSSSRSS